MPPRFLPRRILSAFLPAVFFAVSGLGQPAASEGLNPWYPRFPAPRRVYRTPTVNSIGGLAGDTFFMLNSLAGLAAASVRDGLGDAMVWLDIEGLNEYHGPLLDDLLARMNIADEGVADAWILVDLFAARGVVKGYIVFDQDRSNRGNYGAGAFDESVNVATSLASLMGGIMVTPALSATAQAHGLTELADARGTSEQWAWDTYGPQFSRRMALAQDPKIPLARDYAIANGAFCLFGVDALAAAVYEALDPNTPILGWNQGDERVQTALATDWGHWNAANNLSSNLALLSVIAPGVDVPLADLDLDRRSRVDLPGLVWESDVHYTAMILSDGDAFNLNMHFLNDRDGMYYQHRARGEFPFGWGTAAASLLQTAPGVLQGLSAQATANDAHLLVGGGYFYPDRYGRLRGDASLDGHLEQIAPLLEAIDMRLYWSIYDANQWNSAAARDARARVARALPFLDGAFGIDYVPYTAGQGTIFWNDNGQGVDIPTFMARYSIWANSGFPNEGSPNEVAAYINAAAHEGPANQASHFDWVVVHAWSFFQNGESIPQAGVGPDIENGIERGYGAARWCAERLAPHVRLVTPNELAWYARLHLRPRQTFGLFLEYAQADLDRSAWPMDEAAELQAELDALSAGVDRVNYNDETDQADFFGMLQDLWWRILGRHASGDPVPVVALSSEDGGGTLRALRGDDLSIALRQWDDVPGVTAFALADLYPRFAGPEVILGRGDVLEVRTGQGFALIDSSAGHGRIEGIAVGDVDETLPGAELVVARTVWSAEDEGNRGELAVIDPRKEGLPLLHPDSYVRLWFAMGPIAIGNFNGANPGQEIFATYVYDEAAPATQHGVIDYDPETRAFSVLVFQNWLGRVQAIAAGDLDTAKPHDEVLTGDSDGHLVLHDGDAETGAMHITFRAGFGAITALAVDDFFTHTGLEVAVGSSDNGGTVRVVSASTLLPDLASRAGFGTVPALASGDIHPAPGRELVVTDRAAGAVRIVDAQDPALADIASRSGFDTLTGAGVYRMDVTDTAAPVITLLGETEVDHPYGTPYVDAGATAFDETDGDITARLVATGLDFSVEIPGPHTIRYNVLDAAGNAAMEATRTVRVVRHHSADANRDGRIALPELLVCISLFNAGRYHCVDGPGYAAGAGDHTDCRPHDADYGPPQWSIGLAELLRVVQLYALEGYAWCPDAAPSTEDGFCGDPAR